MLKRILLPVIFIILAYGFWVSPNFKEIAAGVSIFLFGMLFLEEGFKAFTGGLLENLLSKTTNKLWKALSFGIATTTIMQSSSLVSVITISFLSANLITLAAGIGIIFGANIGTTTGAWLIAGFGLKVKISAYAMPMLVFGLILVFQKAKSLRGIGYILAGLGFLFLGIHHMKEGFEAFRDTIDLSEFAVGGYPGLFLYAGIGVAATVIMQSSHATLVLIITALAAQQVTYENALALAIGANIGTTITAIIGSMSSNYQGKRLAAAHLIFNMTTGVIAIGFIYQIMWSVEAVSDYVGINAGDYTLKLAVFHTIFNVIGVAIMSPFVSKLVAFLERAIPAPVREVTEPRYLNDSVIDFPETLMEAVRNEVIHLYDNAQEVMAHGISMHRHHIFSDVSLEKNTKSSREVMDFDLDQVYINKVKSLYAAVIAFISKAQANLPEDYGQRLFELRDASMNIVSCVKEVKHLRKNMSVYIASDNDHIRDEYNKIRFQISQMMRVIDEMRQSEDPSLGTLDLDEIKVDLEEGNVMITGTLDSLIRDGKISAEMGTSLINDLAYARTTIWKLAEMGETLFGSRDLDEHAAELLVSLDDEEIEEMAASAASAKVE